MKNTVILLLALVAYSNAVEDNELVQKWKAYQVEFGKSYRSPLEARHRFNIFSKNLEDIDAHNSRFEKGLISYKKGVNQFADWTDDEFMEFVNEGLVSKPNIVGKPFKAINAGHVPESIDWREKGVVNAVKNQKTCGACWAFSAVAAIESHVALWTGKLTSLSEQNLIDCSWQEGNQGCGGGWMHQAFDYVQENGIESEDDYPYLEDDSNCQADSSKIVTKIRDYVQVPENDEVVLTSVIGLYGPVSVAYISTPNFKAYSSGIFVDESCKWYRLNHGVLAVGYGSENGDDYYIIRNSWGPQWGESGYVRLARNHGNMCNVSSIAHYPEI